jgi:hypothetical protein
LLRPRRVPITLATVGVVLGLCACERRPVELGFWIESVTYSSPRLGGPVSAAELKTIDAIARAEIEQAFQRFEVTVTGNRNARFRVVVIPALRDNKLLRRSGTYAGESRAVAGFGGSGAVSFEYVANGAMVFAPDDASRAEMIAALGRGIGRVAIHEFLHQLLPKFPTHDSKDRESYEGNSPALIEGYFGDLHWDIAAAALEQRLKRR